LAASGGAAGQLYTDAVTTGAILIPAFGGTNTGYLGPVTYYNNAPGRVMLVDRLWGVNIGFTAATTTISGASSYTGRIPTNNYSSLILAVEVTTAFVAGNNWTATINYTNELGTAGRSTTFTITNVANATIGRIQFVSLQAGDVGVQSIQSVVVANGVTAMTAGALNVLVLRKVYTNRAILTNYGMTDGLDKTGVVQLYDTSCIQMLVNQDGTTSGLPEIYYNIFNV
jgi:hypothetical protein